MAYTTINKSTDYFNTKLYTGNGGTQSITGVGFQPDWVWTKQRSGTEHHNSNDAVRGATKVIFPNLTNAEQTVSNLITGFVSDGFSVGDNAGANNNGSTYASWNWKANGAGSANTDGSINSTVSVNTTAGFSIVKYTGTGANATVGHGLGVAPSMIIVKNLAGGSDNWSVYHEKLGANNWLKLNTTDASATDTTIWNNTAPTSSVFSVGTYTNNNGNGNDMIAYCFAEKTGYSKFGSYTGNGNADGTFVYTGFKPSWLMIKRYSTTGHWHIFDIKRNPYYPTSSSYGGMATRLMANLNSGDDLSQGGFEFLSNGLKMTTSWDQGNGNGNSFIYAAFGQSIVGSNNVPATAR